MQTKKRKVDISKEAMDALMQETYYEIVDERNRALAAYKKYTKDINENTDIAMVGKITNDLLKIVDSSIEKKLRLLKIQADILYKKTAAEDSDSDGSAPGGVISESDRKMVMEMIQKERAGVPNDLTKNYE